MSIVLLNVVLISVAIGIAIFLTLVAITMIIVSAVRHSLAKKKDKNTKRVGMWIGIAMLVIPWLVVAFLAIYVQNYKVTHHYQDPDEFRPQIINAVVNKDADALYNLMSRKVIDENNITVEDVERFLDQIEITNVSSDDLKRYDTNWGADGCQYTSDSYLYTGGGRRPESPTQCFWTFYMKKINSRGDKIYFAGVNSDSEGTEDLGLHYVVIVSDELGEIRLGQSETWANYKTPEVEEEAERLKSEFGR